MTSRTEEDQRPVANIDLYGSGWGPRVDFDVVPLNGPDDWPAASTALMEDQPMGFRMEEPGVYELHLASQSNECEVAPTFDVRAENE